MTRFGGVLIHVSREIRCLVYLSSILIVRILLVTLCTDLCCLLVIWNERWTKWPLSLVTSNHVKGIIIGFYLPNPEFPLSLFPCLIFQGPSHFLDHLLGTHLLIFAIFVRILRGHFRISSLIELFFHRFEIILRGFHKLVYLLLLRLE